MVWGKGGWKERRTGSWGATSYSLLAIGRERPRGRPSHKVFSIGNRKKSLEWGKEEVIKHFGEQKGMHALGHTFGARTYSNTGEKKSRVGKKKINKGKPSSIGEKNKGDEEGGKRAGVEVIWHS